MTLMTILTALLVIITGFYAWATFRILRANELVVKVMRDEVEALNRPYINIFLFVKSGIPLFYLKISNSGKTAAKNLRLIIDKPFYQYGEKKDEANLANFNAFSKEIEEMGPGEQIEFALIQSFVVFKNKTDDESVAAAPLKFKITAKYSFANKTVEETHNMDFSPYLNSEIPEDPIASGLEEIKKAIEQMGTRLKS